MAVNAHWNESRRVIERILVEGDLILETPASLSNGDTDELTDIPLLVDPLEGVALLTGTSLAGALRSYLRERELGYGQAGEKDTKPFYAQLFGGLHGDDPGLQSPLITYDALGKKPGVELRDGVKLKPDTRTAEDKKKFDVELLEAGTTFPIRLELLVIEDQEERLIKGLALALQGFEQVEIPLGGRKRRGLGQCRVREWRIRRYDMRTPAGLLGWLDKADEPEAGTNIASLLNVKVDDFEDKRSAFTVAAIVALDTSLLIRSGFGQPKAPDMVHLHSKRRGEATPILSGTSLVGALRARAKRILKTLKAPKPDDFINQMFGTEMSDEIEVNNEDNRVASHLVVTECEIDNGLTDLVQNRVKIDRFTGGSYPGALFNQQPVFGRPNSATTLKLKLILRQSSQNNADFKAQIGLLLLLLKDLWTGDLPLGGEISVGRGRLQGCKAKLAYGGQEWRLRQTERGLEIEGNRAVLEEFVQAFRR